MRTLIHGRVAIALHSLKDGMGTPLLLLHELGANACTWPSDWQQWPGPVSSLDFAGHGESDRVKGGGYYAEYFLADADLALEALGKSTAVAGAGIGAYVALLLAGARPKQIPGALLLPGRGLAGAGAEPDFDRPGDDFETWQRRLAANSAPYDEKADPRVSYCQEDLRPIDYAASFASAAQRLLFGEITRAEEMAPPWWLAARSNSRSESVPCDFGRALAVLLERAYDDGAQAASTS